MPTSKPGGFLFSLVVVGLGACGSLPPPTAADARSTFSESITCPLNRVQVTDGSPRSEEWLAKKTSPPPRDFDLERKRLWTQNHTPDPRNLIKYYRVTGCETEAEVVCWNQEVKGLRHRWNELRCQVFDAVTEQDKERERELGKSEREVDEAWSNARIQNEANFERR